MNEKYARFKALLQAGLPIPQALAQWFIEADEQHSQTGKSLCSCLGIRKPGVRSSKTRELYTRRDQLLKFAVGRCYSRPGEPLWERCGTLAGLVKRWPRSRGENTILDLAFQLEVQIPRSQNRLYEIISRSTKKRLFVE